ncbi:sugar ABC transporter ATP-binding protein [Oceaniglobus roseus]|uniref:sugar ABC transporter ATP-binding protein n=1 Tax=Oceaniglobus roseus TaxID=1737570 RepID=UPI001FEC9DDF|nr:sugar ABC transporter ATP-binding protein [Kandeliimicrobium roseum]
MSDTSPPLVEMTGVTKNYSGITALDRVDFTIRAGEAVCLAGENGSGKSTLIKILAGVEPRNAGTVAFNGTRHETLSPRISADAGVMVIFQDFSLFPNLTVAENIAFSSQLAHSGAFYRGGLSRDLAKKTLERVGVDIPLNARVEQLPVAHKQLVAICRALAMDARLIIMDEPTTALTEREVKSLLTIIRRLKSDGVAVLFVSHKLAEVLEVCEKVVVLRNGAKVAEGPATDFDSASLTRAMTGRDVAETPPDPLDPSAPALLEVTNLAKQGVFDDVSFTLRQGEVLGIAGLLGSGRTELAKALFGLIHPDKGEIRLKDRPVPLGDPLRAADAGIGYVPEDRLTEGLFLDQSIARNVAVGRLDTHDKGAMLDLKGLWAEANDWLKRLTVKHSDPEAPVRSLSGGNQQRVVLARWLATGPKVLILNGPSVGVDVGSKSDIHGIIRDLAREGLGVIVISDDLPELLATCHRLLVMKGGRITDEIAGRDTDETDLGHRLAS